MGDLFEEQFKKENFKSDIVIFPVIIENVLLINLVEENRDKLEKFNSVNIPDIIKRLICPSKTIFTNSPYISERVINFSIIDYSFNIFSKSSTKVFIEDTNSYLREYLKIRNKQNYNINRVFNIGDSDIVLFPSSYRDKKGYKKNCNILLKLDLIKNINRLTTLTKHFHKVKVYLPEIEIDSEDFKVYVYLIDYEIDQNYIDTKYFFINYNNELISRKESFYRNCLKLMLSDKITDTSSFNFILCESILKLY